MRSLSASCPTASASNATASDRTRANAFSIFRGPSGDDACLTPEAATPAHQVQSQDVWNIGRVSW